MAIPYAKISSIPGAIADALEGDWEGLNEIIEDITAAYNWLIEFISDAGKWIMETCLDFYENLPIPLGPFTILLPIVGLPSIPIMLPPNKLYRELAEDDFWKTFDSSTIIRMIVKILTASIGFVMKYITELLDILLPFINLDLTEMTDALNRMIEWFAKLFNPVVKIVDDFLQSLIEIFNITGDKVQEAYDYLYSKIIKLLSGEVPDVGDIPEWLVSIWKFCKCTFILILSLFVGIVAIVGIKEL